MSPVHLNRPRPAKRTAASSIKHYAQLGFLQNVSADWLVPFVAIVSLGYLVYFVTN